MRTNSAAAFPNGWKTRLFGSDGGEVAGVAEREVAKFSGGENEEEEEESMVVAVVVGEAEQGGAVEMRLW